MESLEKALNRQKSYLWYDNTTNEEQFLQMIGGENE